MRKWPWTPMVSAPPDLWGGAKEFLETFPGGPGEFSIIVRRGLKFRGVLIKKWLNICVCSMIQKSKCKVASVSRCKVASATRCKVASASRCKVVSASRCKVAFILSSHYTLTMALRRKNGYISEFFRGQSKFF